MRYFLGEHPEVKMVNRRIEVLQTGYKKKDIKKGKLLLSRRSTLYPCCVPTLGEFKRSWP